MTRRECLAMLCALLVRQPAKQDCILIEDYRVGMMPITFHRMSTQEAADLGIIDGWMSDPDVMA